MIEKIENLSHGAIPRPEAPTIAMHIVAAPVVDFTKPTGLVEPPDEDQGSSGSCTSQADGYYLWQLAGQQVSRNDTYSHTFLPGGGAYLDAPGRFVLSFGFLNRNPNFPEPNPETEDNMEHIILATDAAGRTHTYSYTVQNISADINTIGSILEQFKGCIIGVNGNNAGWQNLVEPTYNPPAAWGHALYIYDRAVIGGKKCLKAKSSWCNEVKNHYIDENYFANGGVFEAIVYENFKEIKNMQLVNDNGTFFLVGDKGKLGIADEASLAKLQAVESTSITGSTASVPQIGIIEQGFVIHN